MLIDTILKDKGNTVETISDKITLLDAAKMLDQKRIGAIVAVDDNGELCGVLSERDIVRRFARNGGKTVDMTVAQAMTRGVITADPAEDVHDREIGCVCRAAVADHECDGIVAVGVDGDFAASF
ncbi:MAG: CBS domain-containing protein, partial [Pseudomonadota bacterium]|nr:CBS domain-containing protein [Pseudomonadota bacterium]